MFVHLHVHTEYSLVDGIIRIDELVERVAALGMPAVAVTDQSPRQGGSPAGAFRRMKERL